VIRRSKLHLLLMIVTAVGLTWPSEAVAQRAVARPRTGPTTGVAVPRTHGPRYYRPVYYPRYYYPYYYPRYYYPGFYYPYYPGFSFNFGFGFGWPAAYWGSYGYGYPYGYGYGYPYYPAYWYDNTGSARLQITPRSAQVYVDGHYVGLVDQFDGSFQRLHVERGQHEVQVYQEGYRTLTQKVLFTPGSTVTLQTALQPLGPGESTPPPPSATATTRPPDRYSGPPDRYQDRYEGQRPPTPDRGGQQAEFGTLALRVNPADAVILIDGEAWDRPAGESRFSIDLAEGPHQVEVRKEGYRPYVRTVDVRRGRTFTLNVSLTPGGIALD
jgi:hypothetical protein